MNSPPACARRKDPTILFRRGPKRGVYCRRQSPGLYIPQFLERIGLGCINSLGPSIGVSGLMNSRPGSALTGLVFPSPIHDARRRHTKSRTALLNCVHLTVQVGLGDKGDDDASKDSVWGDAAALAAAVGVSFRYSRGCTHAHSW